MRKIYRDFVTTEEAEKILKDISQNGKYYLKKRLNKLDYITKIIDTVKKDFDFEISEYSYFKREVRNSHKPHPWHKDTGSKNHMPWCQVGISLLLKEPGFGGETYYAKDNDLFEKKYNGIDFYNIENKSIRDAITNKVKSDRGLYDLVAHTSDEWHEVTGTDGTRCALLMFI